MKLLEWETRNRVSQFENGQY